MKLKEPVNEAYAATIVKLNHTYPLKNSDNLIGARFMGYNAVISKDTEHGLHVMFPAETQLDYKYAHENNLHRHGNLNKDQSQSGYLEDNRRVKAIKLRGNTSSCMIMPLETLAYTGVDVTQFKENDTFDELNGVPICQKYVVKSKEQGAQKVNVPKFSRVDKRLMPEHISTVQWWRHSQEFQDRIVTVTQKIHGTSIRISNIPVMKSLTWKDKIAKFFGVNVSEHEYDYVYGSRKVIKDINDPDKNHFYGTDLWTETGERYKDAVPKNYIIYAEVVGWVDNQKQIQPDYTYNLKPGSNEMYVYRVASVNEDGFVTDLSWDGVVQFCNERGLNHVPELWRGYGRDLNVDDFMNKRYFDMGYKQAVPLSSNKWPDEGICIRYEAQIPVVAKAKCSQFLEKETKDLDKDVEDIEQS